MIITEDWDSLKASEKERILLNEIKATQDKEEKLKWALNYIRTGKKVTKCGLEKYLATEKY